MSSKKKSATKDSWGECRLCQSLIVVRESSYHFNAYHHSSKQNTEQQSTPKSSRQIKEHGNHGYIRQDILHAFVKELSYDEIEALKPLSRVNEYVFLHSATLVKLQIPLGSWVAVWTRDASNFTFLKTWTFATINSFTTAIINSQVCHLLSCEENDVIHIGKISQNQLPADGIEMTARCERKFYDKVDFLNYFRIIADELLLTLASSVYINYRCHELFFKIKNVYRNGADCFTKEDNEIKLNSESQSDIIQDFVNLKLEQTPKRGCQTPPLCTCETTQPKLSQSRFSIHSKTRIKILTQAIENQNKDMLSFSDIGGLDKQIHEIQQLIYLPTDKKKIFYEHGLTPPNGIILFGPAGTGKTLIAETICDTTSYTFVTINGPDLFSKFYGETESRLRSIFEDAKQRAPSIIFIDNIDTMCSKRTGSSTRQEHRVLSTLLSLLDNLSPDPNERVVILAATNDLDSLDPAIRRPGRLDLEIEIGIPDEIGRAEILSKLLQKVNHNLTEDDITNISKQLHAYVGADIAAVCSRAGLCSLKRQTQGSFDNRVITYEDLAAASQLVKPSAMKEIIIEVPKVRWDDVGGQDELKAKLIQAVEWPIKYAKKFEELGITPTKGVLMYGPPGCSKTMIAKALATESKLNFIAIKGPELFDKWVGESERAVRKVFDKARSVAPCILFFDEIDALAAKRGGSSSGGSNVGDRVLTQVLTEMDGIQQLKGVTIVAATNRPDMIDKALLRPGRLDAIVYVSLPDSKTREDIFQIQFRRIPKAEDVDPRYLARQTEGYSGAELVAVCREAALKAMEENMKCTFVTAAHFEMALQIVRPQTSKEMVKFYEDYNLKSKSGSHV